MRVGINNGANGLFAHANHDLGSANWTDQQWHLYTMTMGPDGNADLYVDGAKVVTKEADPVAEREKAWSTAGLFHFGMEMEQNAATDAWSGNLDELAIWKRELSEQEINALYNNGAGVGLQPPTENDILTATHTLEDTDGLGPVSYQWHRNGSAIENAINSTYTLTQNDVGTSISVTVSYIDGENNAESVSTGPIVTVAPIALLNAPSFTSSPVITLQPETPYTYEITTSDPEDDVVTVTAPTLPNWMQLTGTTINAPNLTVSQPDTVVNNYTVPTANLAADTITIPVTDASAFSQGDQVMVIQMQHENSAGTYELRTVESIVNNDITVNAGLTNSYYQSTSSKSQIVRVPQYSDVTVDSGGALTAAAWDGNQGGILALSVLDTVTIDNGGIIDVSDLGFRGAPRHAHHWQNGWADGYRGEGHLGGYDSQGSSANGSGGGSGRAGCPAKANGGGGGGGGNGTAGGNGGNFYDCTRGSASGGIAPGGNEVGSDSVQKLFLGGGGGSGGFHDTSGHTGPAGNGGGIIYVTADAIIIDGSIKANGNAATAFTSSPGSYKGGSGGGAGGTIYLRADHEIPLTNIEAVGGSGSDGYTSGNQNVTPATQKGGDGGNGKIKLVETNFNTHSDTSAAPSAEGVAIASTSGEISFAFTLLPSRSMTELSAIELDIGDSPTYTLTQEDVGSAITVKASYATGESTVQHTISGATTPVANLSHSPTGNVTISGAASPNLLDGLVAYYPLNDGLGATVLDVVGSHNGTLTAIMNFRI